MVTSLCRHRCVKTFIVMQKLCLMRFITTEQIKEFMNENLLAEIEYPKMWYVLACIVEFFVIRMIEKYSLSRHSRDVSSLFHERVLIWIWPAGDQWINVALEDGRKNELSWIAYRSSENVCGQLRYIKNTISKTSCFQSNPICFKLI